MTTATGSLAGVTASAMRVTVPAWGRWWADVSLTEGVELAVGSTAQLTIADVNAQCAIVSGGAAHGRAAYRVAGGFGGWGQVLPRKPYRNDLGVALSGVLGDAAREAGEQIAGLPNTRMGRQYARAEGPAELVLNALSPQAWYVDFEGVTRIGRRPTVAYAGTAPRVRVDPGADVIELAVEDTLAGLVPGVTIDGSRPATDVEYKLSPKRLAVRVYAAVGGLPARLDAYRRIARALDPWSAYRVPREYRVVSQTGERVNLQAVRVASGMPDLSGVAIRPGVAGMRADVKLGETVTVFFIDGDPSRPYVGHHEAADAPGFMPRELNLGPQSGAKAIAIDGDLIDTTALVAPSGGGPVTGVARVVASLTKIKAGE